MSVIHWRDRIGVRLVFEKHDTSFLVRMLCQVWGGDGDTINSVYCGLILKIRAYKGFIAWCQVFPETLFYVVIRYIFRVEIFFSGFLEKCDTKVQGWLSRMMVFIYSLTYSLI